MTETEFIERRRDSWQEIERMLVLKRGKGSLREDLSVRRFPGLYRELCGDLNRARAEHYSLPLQERLNRLVLDSHILLYRAPRPEPLKALKRGMASAPAAVRASRKLVLGCALAFYGTAVLFFAWASGNRDRASDILGDGTVSSIESMYDPASEHFLHPREVTGDADMFGYYISNNIGIGLGTMAAGVLAGLGSLFVLVFNGAFLGAAAAVAATAGYSSTFFPFVSGHSAFELTAIVLFAASGFILGRAILAPGRLSRYEALRRAGERSVPVAGLAFAFMAIAAGIEAFWSSRPLDPTLKYAVAALLWAGVASYLAIGGRSRAR